MRLRARKRHSSIISRAIDENIYDVGVSKSVHALRTVGPWRPWCRRRQPHTDAIDLTRNPKGYQTLLQTITPIHTAYAHVAIHKVFLDTKRRMFIVVVKGNGSRYCQYRLTTHTSNRVFFCVNLMRGRIYTHCFDPECKRRYGTTPLSQPLSRQDKSRLTADFALPETSTRPTLTCASARTCASAVVDTETRRTKWLAKVRTYQLLLHAQE